MKRRSRIGLCFVALLATLLAVSVMAGPPQERQDVKAKAAEAADLWDPCAAAPGEGQATREVPAIKAPVLENKTGLPQACAHPMQKVRRDGDSRSKVAPPAAQASLLATVLWDQPADGANGIIAQHFSDYGAGVYSADDFVVAAPWDIGLIFVDGQGSALNNATSLNWAIYADAAGVPAGYPGGGAPPLWSLSLAPAAPGITLSDVNTQVTLDVLAAGSSVIHLVPGTYWLVFYPSMSFGAYGQWFWDTSGTTNGSIAQVIDPTGLVGLPASWSPWTLIDPSAHDAAFRLEAAACTGILITGTYDNGPLVTHPGGGSGGADASALQSGLGMNTYGFGNQYIYGYRMADDFTVTDPAGWDIDSIEFFAYQTGSTTTSTITGVYYQIWDGDPSNPASSVVFGDLTTNRMTGTTWSNIYRVVDTDLTANNRPVMVNTVSCGTHLAPGTYWLDWMTDGSLSSGPWAPPVSILGQVTTGNALQYTTAWAPALDTGTPTQQDMPFLINWSMCITCPTITLTPTTLPPTLVGLPYSQVLTAAGGTAPYVITYTGSLPPGLTFTDNGDGTATIAGTPTGTGAFDIVVTATDDNGCEGSQAYTASTYSASFEDDTYPLIFCVDTATGDYGWGVGGGTPPAYYGRAEVMNGGAYIWNGPADPNFLYVVYDPVQHRAYGYYYDTGCAKFFSLFDSDTTDNVGACP